jgi:hypothetical protein
MSTSLSGIAEVMNEGFGKITSDEKIIIARETNRARPPRELVKWLQSLDLSYKIKNISRDLANGFCIAEILSRYPVPFVTSLPYDVTNYYRVNMHQFSNGISFSERTTNWNHITEILTKKYHMTYPPDLPEKVKCQAPNAALEFLVLLYKFLTRKNLNVLNQVDETEKFKNYAEFSILPNYMRPTTNLLIRDNELQRIKDDLVRKFKIENTIQNHNKFLSEERENQKNMEQFNRSRKIPKKIEQSSIGGGSKIGSTTEKNQNNLQENEINDVKNESNSQVSNDNLKEERINLIGILNELNEENREQENVENEFKLIIRKNFVETDKNIEMDLKNYSSDKDLLEYFFEKITLCSNENFEKIFSSYEDKEKDFIGIISRTLIELDPFIKILCQFFEAFYKNHIPWIKFRTTTLNICKSIHDITKDKCDNIFLNFCLNYVLDMIEKNPLYRNEMCQFIFSLTSNTSETHLNLLKKVAKKLCGKNEIIFYHILIQCMNNIKDTDEIITQEIVIFYNDAIIKGISSSDNTIVIKSIYLIIQLMRFDYFYCLKYYQDIFKYKNSFNWEILSLILIYCSRMLELYNRQKLMTEQNFLVGKNFDAEFDNNEKEEKLEESKEKIKNENLAGEVGPPPDDKLFGEIKGEEFKNMNENEEEKEENKSQISNKQLASIDKIEDIQKDPNEDNDAKKLENDVKYKISEIQKCENVILEIIDHIFNISSPRMTIKIGFIYLAEILEFYPNLAKKYMKLLIEYKDNTIRKEVLKVNKSTEEYEYTMNCFTERYKICGTPYLWNQLIIAGIFRDYVIENLERFESTHLLILHSIIIHQDFNEEESKSWIILYNDLKKYLFVSLCEKQFSNVALSILNKIFSFGKILKELLDSTFDLFISTMKIIYGDEIMDEPHENMKTLLTFISEIKSENNDCKGYVYKLIKTFAIQNDKKYLKSNLLPLMNSISNEKRGNIFDE